MNTPRKLLPVFCLVIAIGNCACGVHSRRRWRSSSTALRKKGSYF